MDEQAIRVRFLQAQDRLVFQASDLSLGTIASMVSQKAIDLDPGYQRRERWDIQKQSTLIESFLLNVPVPPVYLAEDEFGEYSVVDGKQRITSIHGFMSNNFSLRGLESFHELEGVKFVDLPRELQNALTVRPYLRVITLLKQSDPSLKYEVFTRLNRGGENMEPQELRNVAFRSPLNDLVFELGGNDFLKKKLKIKDRKSSAYQVMADAEYVLRFLTLRDRWNSFSGDYRWEMDLFMLVHRDARKAELQEYKVAFENAIQTCAAIWGENAFKRPTSEGWRDQLLSGMYDAQMIAVDLLTQEQRVEAINNSISIISATRSLFKNSNFENSVRQGTNTPARLRYRINQIFELLIK